MQTFYGYGIGLDVLKLNLLELGKGYLAWLPTSPELMTVLAHAEHNPGVTVCYFYITCWLWICLSLSVAIVVHWAFTH